MVSIQLDFMMFLLTFVKLHSFFFNLEKEINLVDDPALDGSIAKVIFESASFKIKNDINVFFKMLREASQYSFANELANEIKR